MTHDGTSAAQLGTRQFLHTTALTYTSVDKTPRAPHNPLHVVATPTTKGPSFTHHTSYTSHVFLAPLYRSCFPVSNAASRSPINLHGSCHVSPDNLQKTRTPQGKSRALQRRRQLPQCLGNMSRKQRLFQLSIQWKSSMCP